MSNQEIIKAIVKTQLEIVPPVKDKINPRFKTSYSSLDAIYSSVRIPLAKNGLTLSHSVETLDGKSTLVTTLRHVSGEEVINRIPMFLENMTSQGFAGSLTYSRRYAICSLLGLPNEEDDDGEAAEEQFKPKESTEEETPMMDVTDKQIAYMTSLGNKNKEVMANILSHYKINSFEDMKGKKIKKSVIDSMISSLQGVKKNG